MDYARGRHAAAEVPSLPHATGSDDLDMVAALRAQLEAMLPVRADAANAAVEDRIETEMAELFMSLSVETGITRPIDHDEGDISEASTYELLDELDRLWAAGNA
jgi:hypothetical protein